MALFESLHEQQMARLGNIANGGHENWETVRHFSDLDHIEHKRSISLAQAMGVREVQSTHTPAGPAPRSAATPPA
jgi:hypothetical protein